MIDLKTNNPNYKLINWHEKWTKDPVACKLEIEAIDYPLKNALFKQVLSDRLLKGYDPYRTKKLEAFKDALDESIEIITTVKNLIK